jgi:quercetin dioxygenase-like cupin family protein
MNYTVTLDGRTICGNRRTPDDLGLSMIEAISYGHLDRYEPPLSHYFAPGLYGRRIYVDAGVTVVTMKHKTDHISIALKGRCVVVDGEGNRKIVEAPDVWVTHAGTQRSVYCETDTEWVTVHTNPDNITDVDTLETVLAKDTLQAEKVARLGDALKALERKQ